MNHLADPNVTLFGVEYQNTTVTAYLMGSSQRTAICSTDAPGLTSQQSQDAARRIAVCLESLGGISTEQLEAGYVDTLIDTGELLMEWLSNIQQIVGADVLQCARHCKEN